MISKSIIYPPREGEGEESQDCYSFRLELTQSQTETVRKAERIVDLPVSQLLMLCDVPGLVTSAFEDIEAVLDRIVFQDRSEAVLAARRYFREASPAVTIKLSFRAGSLTKEESFNPREWASPIRAEPGH